MWNECNCSEFEHSLALPFSRIGMKTDLSQSCGHCWVFPICWHTECSTFKASSFRIWNSSSGIPSPPLALLIVIFPKVHLTLHSRCLALGEWPHHHGYLGHSDLFCIVLCTLVTSSVLLGLDRFCPLLCPIQWEEGIQFSGWPGVSQLYL